MRILHRTIINRTIDGMARTIGAPVKPINLSHTGVAILQNNASGENSSESEVASRDICITVTTMGQITRGSRYIGRHRRGLRKIISDTAVIYATRIAYLTSPSPFSERGQRMDVVVIMLKTAAIDEATIVRNVKTPFCAVKECYSNSSQKGV